MAHVRAQIRAWLAMNLTGSAEAGKNVYEQRTLPLSKQDVPALIFSVQGERVTTIDLSSRQQRIVTVRVTAVVKGDNATGSDTLDALGAFVEEKIAATPKLGGFVKYYEYLGSNFAFNSDGERTLCMLSMDFALAVFTRREDPETAI